MRESQATTENVKDAKGRPRRWTQLSLTVSIIFLSPEFVPIAQLHGNELERIRNQTDNI